jgi:hypothetical protein
MLSKETLTKIFPDWEDGLYDAILNEAELKEAKAGTTLLKMGQNIKSAMLSLKEPLNFIRKTRLAANILCTI